jgi:transposase-like protein
MAEKRKLVSYSLEKKYEIIKAIEGGTSRKNIQDQYGVKHNTLSGWMKNSQQIKEQYESKSLKSD